MSENADYRYVQYLDDLSRYGSKVEFFGPIRCWAEDSWTKAQNGFGLALGSNFGLACGYFILILNIRSIEFK